MQKTYLIGDVHGCDVELQELIRLLKPTSADRLIFIGDLIDRGPNSVEVIRLVVNWSKEMEVKLILGNHEEKFLRYLKHVDKGSGNEKEMTGAEEFPTLLRSLTDFELEFLHQSYYSLHLPEFAILLVHGGIWKTMPFSMPATYPYLEEDSASNKQKTLLTKVRTLNSAGKFVSLGNENPSDHFWAEQYDGRFGHVFFGHQPFLIPSPMRYKFATGIDTGCVYGGWLSAVEIQKDTFNYTSVPAKKTYVTR